MQQPGLVKRARQAPNEPVPGEAPPDQAMPEEDDGPGEDHPAYQAGMEFMGKALYKSGAADSLVKLLPKTENLPQEMADIAYEMASIVDEKTEGAIPPELLMSLGADALEQIVVLASEAGREPAPQEIGTAFRLMVERYASEQGHDIQELQAAFDQVDPSYFDQIAQMDVA